jgi:hypothetical protein
MTALTLCYIYSLPTISPLAF